MTFKDTLHYKFLSMSIYLIVGVVSLGSCQNTKVSNIVIDEQALLQHIKVISHDSLEGRFFSTPGNYKAQKYIKEQFASLNIPPAFNDGYIQQFPHTLSGKSRQRIYPIANVKEDYSNVTDTIVKGGNVVAMLKGKTNKTIVITGHLDHLGIKNGQLYNGADDDASGTAALFAIASYFKTKPIQHNLVFAAVDAEEIGSPGCAYLLDNFPLDIKNVVLNINMDMISHNDSSQLYASGLYHYPQLQKPLDEIVSSIDLLYGHDDPNNKDVQDWTYSSDHREFHERKIPFIYFGVEDHKDYHQPTDTFENINPKFYIEAVKLIIQAIEGYDTFLIDK